MKIEDTITVPLGQLHAGDTFSYAGSWFLVIAFSPNSPGFNIQRGAMHVADIESGRAGVFDRKTPVTRITLCAKNL
jgi:hypothetical protein